MATDETLRAPMDLDQALEAILADIRPVTETESIDVSSAQGRVLAESVSAPINLPPFAASAMDGFAVHSGDVAGSPPHRLRIGGSSYAGHPFAATTPSGTCVRIFTGAAVPDDLDAVVIQENCRIDGDHVWIEAPVHAGDNIRPPGHDIAKDTLLLDRHRLLTPFDIGWLSACGIVRIEAYRRCVVGIFSTGDELLDAGSPPGAGQIFDANRITLAALLGRLPVRVRDFGIVADDRERIRETLEEADASCDVVLTSGGVSVGEADWVRDVVGEIGRLDIWKLNLKPGKPLAYGHLGHAVFFGLPGNPVSTIVTALMLAHPAILRLCGTSPTAPLTVPAVLRGHLQHHAGREEFQRGTLRVLGQELEVTVTGDQSSNRLASFAAANCLIRIPKSCGDLVDGSRVLTLPLWGML